jgi:alpha-ketoglutarate-dependent taurine dioxygenase
MSISKLRLTQAWGRETIAPESWQLPLPERLLDCLDGLLRSPPEDLTAMRLPEEAVPRCREALRPAAAALESGVGFVVLTAPASPYDDRQRTLLYWLVGQALGRPVTQNVQGTLLYDVRDTGQDVRYGARFSVTNADSSFHTDASFCDDLVDYVGLLCLKPARTGGVNHVVSGRTVHAELAARHPQALAVLGQPFHVDRRGGTRPGEAPTALFPVLRHDGSEPVLRYLRYWIEAGHDRAGQPLTAAQVEALDCLDGVLADPALRAEFSLRPGEMFFLNNRWMLHSRTAFEDHAEPERRRHLVRLWLARLPVAASGLACLP